MPFETTKTDYILAIGLIIIFIILFFLQSTFADLHVTFNTEPNANIENINMAVYIIPIFSIFMMVKILVFQGKSKIGEMQKRLFILKAKITIKEKIHHGIQEYNNWRLKGLYFKERFE